MCVWSERLSQYVPLVRGCCFSFLGTCGTHIHIPTPPLWSSSEIGGRSSGRPGEQYLPDWSRHNSSSLENQLTFGGKIWFALTRETKLLSKTLAGSHHVTLQSTSASCYMNGRRVLRVVKLIISVTMCSSHLLFRLLLHLCHTFLVPTTLHDRDVHRGGFWSSSSSRVCVWVAGSFSQLPCLHR